MTWVSKQVTLGTASVQVVAPDNMPHEVMIHNATKSSNEYIFIGPDATTSANNAFHIDPGQTVYITLMPEDEIWACSDPSGLDIHIADVQKPD